MLTLVTGPPSVGKTTFLKATGRPCADIDHYARRRFGLPKMPAINEFHANFERNFAEFADFVTESKAEYVADCAVRPEDRAHYVREFGPVRIVYLTAGLPELLARNAVRPDPIPPETLVEKYVSQRLPTPKEGFMSIYLKKADEGVIAFGDQASLDSFGGTCDMVVTDDAWRECGCVARIGARGEIVLGASEEAVNAANEEAIRTYRNRRLRRCDHFSPMRWESMSDSEKKAWSEYRQALLDITDQPGFPWGGDATKAPWPTKPE